MAELTSYKKTKTTQQQSPQHDSHRSPDSWPCRRTLPQRSVPIAAAASSGQKATIPNKVRGELGLLMALTGRRFHPGRWLSASDRLRLTLSCRSSVVSFRREEAAPPPAPPPPLGASSSSSCCCSYCCCGRSYADRPGCCYTAVNALLPPHSQRTEPGPGGRTPNFRAFLRD